MMSIYHHRVQIKRHQDTPIPLYLQRFYRLTLSGQLLFYNVQQLTCHNISDNMAWFDNCIFVLLPPMFIHSWCIIDIKTLFKHIIFSTMFVKISSIQAENIVIIIDVLVVTRIIDNIPLHPLSWYLTICGTY